MLALASYEAQLCGRCKHPTAEAWAYDATYDFEAPIRCHACDAYMRAGEAYQDSQRPQALIHLVHRRG